MEIKRIFSANLSSYMNDRVLVMGWLHALRRLGKLSFLILRDRDGLFQLILNEFEAEKLKGLHVGTIISALGKVVASKRNDNAPELHDVFLEIIQPVKKPPSWDYTKDDPAVDLDVLLDTRGFSVRSPSISSIFKAQSVIVKAFRDYMCDVLIACEFFGPCLLPGSSEGGANLFLIDHFGTSATLAQSNQLYKQILVGSYERVFAVMPFFRADPSHTTRHLSEAKQLEFEMGFCSLEQLLFSFEDLLRQIDKALLIKCGINIIPSMPKDNFPRVTFKEACCYLGNTELEDLGSSDEKKLCAWAKEKFGSDFLFITHWPKSVRPFYSFPNIDGTTETFDLLCNGIELASGGMRRHSYENVLDGLTEFGLNPIMFQIYLQAFQAGMPPHGGFGMGLERLTMALLGLQNIREASLFPSDYKRIAGEKQSIKGSEPIRTEIIKRLRQRCLPFTLIDKSNLENQVGIKALILQGKSSKKFFQANLLLSSKLQVRFLQSIVGESLEFASPEKIHEHFGLTVGSIPPFGSLFGVQTFLDRTVMEHEGPLHFSSGKGDEYVLLSSIKEFHSLIVQEVVSISG